MKPLPRDQRLRSTARRPGGGAPERETQLAPKRRTIKRHLRVLLTGVALGVTIVGCQERPASEPKKPTPPAKVENAVKETDLTRVTLSPEAEKRLGIETTAVESRQIRRMRTLGGDIVVPPGRQIIVSAPLAGTLTMPETGQAPTPGGKLISGQTVLRLLPAFLSDREVLQPSDRISLDLARANLSATIAEAEGEVASADVQVEAAKVKMDRADKLRKENVGSVRAYEEAEAELRLAEARVKAARDRLDTLKSIHLDAASGTVASLAIQSPQNGLLQRIHAVPGTVVAAGTPLFEVVSIDPVWVRVSLYAGDIETIDPQAPANVTDLASTAGSPSRSAKPIAAPPSADASAATVDRFYQLDNADGLFLPGQRVGVTLTLKSTEASLVVPFNAILYDINGGTWVYENMEPQVFVRRRVEVRHVVDGVAVLRRGPDMGTKIVTAGAAELFGTEFGGGK